MHAGLQAITICVVLALGEAFSTSGKFSPRRSASLAAVNQRGAGYGGLLEDITETIGNTPMVSEIRSFILLLVISL
jgi:hypothetical protein